MGRGRILRGPVQLAHNVLAGAMHRQNAAALKAPRLARGGSLQNVAVGAKPRLENAVSAHPLVYAACNRLYFRQFRHRLIVEECRETGRGGATSAGSLGQLIILGVAGAQFAPLLQINQAQPEAEKKDPH